MPPPFRDGPPPPPPLPPANAPEPEKLRAEPLLADLRLSELLAFLLRGPALAFETLLEAPEDLRVKLFLPFPKLFLPPLEDPEADCEPFFVLVVASVWIRLRVW